MFAIQAGTETDRWQCVFLPDKGAFFVNYVVTSALIGTSLELIRFPELIMYAIRLSLSRCVNIHKNLYLISNFYLSRKYLIISKIKMN